ncbi:MAG: pentapeptide repeat-containing protein [Thermomicrobiales bacterium]
MDAGRFDRLTRALGASTSRRATVAGILSAMLGGTFVETTDAAKRRKGKDNAKGRGRKPDKRRDRDQQSDKDEHSNPPPDQGEQPAPPVATVPASCCSTGKCTPGAGKNLSRCCYENANLAGTTFRAANLSDANFRNANLTNADFRGANLSGACLVGADITGARFGGANLNKVIRCRTKTTDGIDNSGCDKGTDCCRTEEGGTDCQRDADCLQFPCDGAVCQNGTCVRTTVTTGPSPNNLCSYCCGGTCCQAPANQCNAGGLCCAPNCAGKQCGADGCGSGGTCGTCPDGLACNAEGQCVCTPQSCGSGCCDSKGACQPGTTNQACGKNGETCAACGAGDTCQKQVCATCIPDCAGKKCGPNGCGGSCGSCADGQVCLDGECICDARSCPDGCCANGPGLPGVCRSGSNRQACGAGGEQCAACPAGKDCIGQQCLTCSPQTCPHGCCAIDGTCQSGNAFGACGGPGGGPCASCNGQQTCENHQCVTCGPTCICTGQSICTDPGGNNLVCTGPSDPQVCFCYVSQSGQPICGTPTLIYPNGCGSDADCGNGVCVDSVGATGPCAGNGKPFCVTPCCTPDCTGKVCGPDGCGGNCGTCEGALQCKDGQCVSTCTPETCPHGCCAADGSCQPGTTSPVCGTGGVACRACSAGQGCIEQQCIACTPKTCQELGNVCGPYPDGCGGTLQCGLCPAGDTPVCNKGVCASCPATCSETCNQCNNLVSGETLCGSVSVINCQSSCSSDADCSGTQYPTCAASWTERATGVTTMFGDYCQTPGVPGVCVSVVPCCVGNCTGKICGSDGCIGSCGDCGQCQLCQNNGTVCVSVGEPCGDKCCVDGAVCCGGSCCPSGQSCCNGVCCESGATCCGGTCCASNRTCCTDSATPYCCIPEGPDGFCGCCNGLCCCP